MIHRFAVAAGLLIGGAAWAQDAGTGSAGGVSSGDRGKTPDLLVVGAKAPPLSIEKWIKGDPVERLEPGKAYVVEFWATWCTPCRGAMRHLTELRENNSAAGLTVIGVASPAFNEELEVVEKFVATMGDRMGYTVAWDREGATAKTWHEASGRGVIPAAMVVNTDGRVAWIGNPLYPEGEMAAAAEAAAAGKFDMGAAVARSKKDAETTEKKNKILVEVGELWKAGKKAEAMDKLEEAIALDPVRFGDLAVQRFGVLLTELKDPARAYAYARKLTDGPFKGQAGLLDSIASLMLDEGVEKKDVPLAIRLAERAAEVSKGRNAGVLETLARAYFVSGDPARAAQVQERAVAAAADEEERAELAGDLEKYRKAAAKVTEKR